jgi:serine/threonine protein kinase
MSGVAGRSALANLQDRILGDFVLGEVLGEGGGGTVYRAEQRGLGRPAVVKVLRPSLSLRRDAVDRFAREARLASQFDHPYAAHVYAFGIEPDGVMWIAMELVRGTPLDELLRESGPLALERFVPLFERLCDVVQSAHDQGIVHRDIKPSNVMVISRARRLLPKLLDFGIAKPVTDSAVALVGEAPGRRGTSPENDIRAAMAITGRGAAVQDAMAQETRTRDATAQDAAVREAIAPAVLDTAPPFVDERSESGGRGPTGSAGGEGG